MTRNKFRNFNRKTGNQLHSTAGSNPDSYDQSCHTRIYLEANQSLECQFVFESFEAEAQQIC